MVIKPGFEMVDIAGEQILVPIGEEAVTFGGIVALSEAASFLLKNMSEPKTKEELVCLLISEYDIEEDIAKSDIEKWTTKMLDMGIIKE